MSVPPRGGPALVAHLRETWAGEALPFHMPGHKAGAGAPAAALELLGPAVYAADVSELGGFDYLHEPEDALVAAQAQAAALCGAERSWFLVNGATVGNLAAILAVVGDGDGLLVARDSHRSVYAGLMLSGARPRYLPPLPDAGRGGRFGVDPAAVAAALRDHPEIRAVHVTSPNASGFAVAVEEVAAAAAAHGVPLIVDEAHGAHFALHERLPRPALACGADLVVHSPHKSLGALTQTALLHHQGERVDPSRVAEILPLLQSSSPSVPLLLSLSLAVDAMATSGRTAWGAVLALADDVRRALDAVPGLEVWGEDVVKATAGLSGFDPTKLVVDVGGLGVTGFAAARWLVTERRLHPESADLRGLVFALTVGDDADTAAVLVEALEALAAAGLAPDEAPDLGSLWPPVAPDAPLTPREAFGRPSVAVPLAEAAGRVSAEMLVPYPPGVPLVVAGELLSEALVAAITQLQRHGARIVGLADPTGATLRCLVRREPPPGA